MVLGKLTIGMFNAARAVPDASSDPLVFVSVTVFASAIV